jgi:hypothetical protein
MNPPLYNEYILIKNLFKKIEWLSLGTQTTTNVGKDVGEMNLTYC